MKETKVDWFNLYNKLLTYLQIYKWVKILFPCYKSDSTIKWLKKTNKKITPRISPFPQSVYSYKAILQL